ncbi:MAG: tRNA (N6-isopentenyl adenosine(37)-C2)-methylthiotransferase MiaB [Candidatus Omnitrophica bacterium]|nr:tRNA (N6-isopentenyl adenosine(37)-C2)-methylthiotransferase MiaB [Candidatus Omnitrophota bacterium]
MNKEKTCQPKVFVKTFGCQMNMRDSEHVAGILIDNGFRLSGTMDDADVILFNSCSVRKHAEERLFGNIACLKGLKKKRPGLVIALMGCTAQAYEGKAMDRSSLIDIVCGPGNETDLPRLIKDVLKKRCHIIAVDKFNKKRPELFPKYREHKFKALVSISEGCDNFCSYCIVPYLRGRERSRHARDIIREVKGLAGRGFKEVLLLGQNVNSYKAECGKDFIKLLEDVNKIKGIERIRFMTSHPKDAHKELFRAMRDLDKVCEHLHLPLQSGSDRILKLMNRRYTSGKYLNLAEEYKRIVPGGSLTTDIIAGFPSETDSDFKKTCVIMKDVGFDSSYTFKYSPRERTKASELADDVPDDVKASRLKSLSELQCGISEERNRRLTDKVVEVLVEGVSKKDGEILTGRTGTNKPAVFKGSRSLVGRSVDVEIESVTAYALRGRIVR